MKKYLLSFILSVATFVSASADKYTGVLVTNGSQKTCYLFEEQPVMRRKVVDGVMNACLYVAGNADPVVSVPLENGAKLSTHFVHFTRVNLNDAGYATFSCKDASYIATEGVTAYKAFVGDELITLHALDGNIPAGEGVMLYGATPNAKVDLPVATSGFLANVTDNSLKPTTMEDGSLAGMEANVWVLGGSNLFLRYTGASFIHNRAYLVHQQSAETAEAKSMRMVFAEDETTALDNVTNSSSTLNGKFMEDGKIVIVKNGMKYNVTGQTIK